MGDIILKQIEYVLFHILILQFLGEGWKVLETT